MAASGDTITFDPNLASSTIILGSQIELGKDQTIDGSGLNPNVVISGNHNNRIFQVTDGATALLNHLDIISGNADIGGGVDNDNSTLLVSNCRFDSNNADSGGAINNNNGTLTVADCTFYINGAVTYGGAINNHLGNVDISGSTFFGNFSGEYAGGVFNNVGTITVTNSTFVENHADTLAGGLQNYLGTLTVSNSTLSGNYAPTAGGIATGGTLHLMNSIIANSTSGGDCANFDTIATNINNLIEDGTCSPAVTGDPMLEVLADNGGPTRTMAIPINSPAFDAGDNATCEVTDQRGVSRPQGPHCDIGAFERDYFFIFLPLLMK